LGIRRVGRKPDIDMRYISLFFLVLISGCQEPTPVVVLDGWWNTGFAVESCRTAQLWARYNSDSISRFGCNRVVACKEMMPAVEACATDIAQAVREFESELATNFASSSECHLVRFVRMGNPKEASADAVNAMQGSYYSLPINFNPGALEQPWEMLSSPSHTAYTKGHGTPQDIAKRVCAIVKHEGATLSD